MNKLSTMGLAIAAISTLLSCASPAPTGAHPEVPTAAQEGKVAAPIHEQPIKPQHECVGGELSQYYVVETARLEGEPSAHLNYCFVSGYRGIDCPDDWNTVHALGQSPSNRERAGCDAIMRRIEQRKATDEARKKRLDDAYDRQHGLTPAK